MNPKTQEELIEVLKQIADELNSINANTSNINTELEKLNSQDFYGSSDDCTSDIAKNIADIGLLVIDQLKGITYCLDNEGENRTRRSKTNTRRAF